MKYGVYMNWEGSLVLIEKHPVRDDRVIWKYLFRDKVETDQPLLNFFKFFIKDKYEYLGEL